MTGRRKSPPETPEGSKWCRHCETTKPVAEFGPSKRAADGLSSWCKPCHVQASRLWRKRTRVERQNLRELRRLRAEAAELRAREINDARILEATRRDADFRRDQAARHARQRA